jgi:hypothetical protein
VDWNRDGRLDILSGCYWTDGAKAGHVLMLAGRGGLDFDEAEPVTNADGQPLTNLPITDSDDERITLNICTHQHAVDYDADGDLDLVVGCFGPNFYFHENTGGEDAASFSGTPELLPVKSPSHHAAPHLVDWDGDGDLDLLSGTADGGVIISHNTGSRAEPVWSDFQQLIEPNNQREQLMWEGAEVQPAASTRVWATDWNRDGQLDLLVGDCVALVRPAEGVNREEFERQRAELDEKTTRVSQKNTKFMEQYQQAAEEARRNKSEIDPELKAQFDAVQQEYRELFSSRGKFQQTESTGFVWLYLRAGSDRVATR